MKKEELLKGLTEEQIAKIKACKNNEEVLKLAKEEGVELNDEQLQAVSGGCGASTGVTCPKCGSQNIYFCGQNLWYEKEYKCKACNNRFWHN